MLPLCAVQACSAAGQAGGPLAASEPTLVAARAAGSSESPLGSYLAGRFARAERDTAAAAQFFSKALADDPENPALLRRTLMLYAADGRIGEASRLSELLVRHEPKDGVANLVLAVEEVRGGRPGAAARRLQDVPRTGFNMLLVPMVGAWGWHGEGSPEKALETLAVLQENTAFAPFYHYHAALLHDLAGRAGQAERDYRQVITGGASLRAVQAFGNFLLRQGRAGEARSLYQDYLRRHPESPVVLQELAELEQGGMPPPLVSTPAEGAAEALYGAASVLSRDDGADAGEIYSHLALRLRPEFTLARMLLAEMHENSRLWDKAIQTYRAVDRGSPFFDNARLRIAWALRQSERVDEALALLREMVASDPTRTDALVTMGDILRGEEKFAEAAAEYSRAIALIDSQEERHWTLFYARGIAYERQKRWDLAEPDFLRALALKPDQPLVLNYLGYSWVEKGVNLDRARAMIERAVQLRPNDGYIVDSLGWALYRLGQYQEAVTHLERAVELRPEDATINDHLGDALWKVGREAEARFQWRRALSLEPEADLVAGIRQKIESGLVASPGKAAQRKSG